MGDTYDEQGARYRAERWMRRFTDRLSWRGLRILEDLRREEREVNARVRTIEEFEEEREDAQAALREVLDRLTTVPEEERRNVRRAWQLERHALILSRSAIAGDDAELDRFVELSPVDRLTAEMVLSMHEANTVDGALRSWAERGAACEEADRRRASFRAL